MPERHILTREQIDEIVAFSVKEGEFGEECQIGIDEPVLHQMISTMLSGFGGEVTDEAALVYDDIWDWIEEGIENGWCAEPSCVSHDGIPSTEEEAEEFEEGYDPCQFVVRLWGD